MVSPAVAASVMLPGGLVLRMFWVPEIPAVQVSLTPGSILAAADGYPVFGNALAAGESWTLGQGVAEIRFPDRVRALIDGPVSLRVVAEARLEISGGHSWFHVPVSAAGFRVVAPGFKVKDPGTAFGIDLREELPPQVHCWEGLVEIRTRIGNRLARLLAAGQAAVLRPNGRWTERSGVLTKVRTTLPMQIRSLTLGLTELRGHVIAGIGDMPGVDGAYIESDWPGISGSAPLRHLVLSAGRLPAPDCPSARPLGQPLRRLEPQVPDRSGR